MTNKNIFWLSLCNFSDIGILPIYWSKDFPLASSELKMVANYYSIVVSSAADKSLIGPLPVSYHPELLVLIYRFEIIDKTIKDVRVVQAGGKTDAFIIILYNVVMDDIFTLNRKRFLDYLTLWSTKNVDVSKLNESLITEISFNFENFINQSQIIPQNVPESERNYKKLFIRQLDLLSRYVKQSYQLIIISDIPKLLVMLQEFFLSFGWNFIESYSRNTNMNSFELKMGKIIIIGESSDTLKLGAKEKSIIYFAEIKGAQTTKTTITAFKNIVASISGKQQALITMFNPDGEVKFEESSLYETTSAALGKNLSIVELQSTDTGIYENIVNFMYLLIEKMMVK